MRYESLGLAEHGIADVTLTCRSPSCNRALNPVLAYSVRAHTSVGHGDVERAHAGVGGRGGAQGGVPCEDSDGVSIRRAERSGAIADFWEHVACVEVAYAGAAQNMA
jgi:hypothetical protein